MSKKDDSIIRLLFMSILFYLMIIPLTNSVSLGGFFEDITGRYTSAPTNVTIAVGSLKVFNITTIPSQTVVENSMLNVSVSYLVDADAGVVSLSNTSAIVEVNFSSGGTDYIHRTVCNRQADFNSTRANYTCSVYIWYYEAPGTWVVQANITDLNGNYAKNDATFSLSDTTAIIFAPQSLTWATISAGTKNQTSNNDPVKINNTGNHNSAAAAVRVTAINLIGVTTPANLIPAANFSVFNATGASNPECGNSGPTPLVNNTATGLIGLYLQRGNNSLQSLNGIGSQALYFCLSDVPLAAVLSAQTYSTNNSGSWTISVI